MVKNFFKKQFLFWCFYRLRLFFWPEERIKSRILARAHLLEKASREGKDSQLLIYELVILFFALSKRGATADQSLCWANEILFSAQFKMKLISDAVDRYSKEKSQAIEKLIRDRRSIRRWSAKKVNLNDITDAIDAAKWAPNSCNRQGWFFLVLNKKDDFLYVKKLTNQDFFLKSKVLIVAMIDSSKYSRDDLVYGYLDIAAAIQNLLLVLHSKNLGACWLGLKESVNFKKSIAEFRRRFQLKESYLPISFLAVGYYDEKPKPPLRKSSADIYKIIK
jgi:nitroreductase